MTAIRNIPSRDCGVGSLKLQLGEALPGPELIYSFPCPGCGQFISLPRQSHLGSVSPSQYLCSAVWPILFICPQLSLMSAIPPSKIQLTPRLFNGKTPRMNTLWEIDAVCRLENCGRRRSVYTYCLNDTEPNSILQMFLNVRPQIDCLGGHPAKFHRDSLIANRLV
jgi:hypothetical protein